MAYSVLNYLQNFVLPLASKSRPQHSSSDLVGQIEHEIRKRLMQPITIGEFAETVSISPSYLSHLFKCETGMTPIAYASMLKVDLTKILLNSTGKFLEDIALSLGYTSSASFISAFHSRTNRTTLAWRNWK